IAVLLTLGGDTIVVGALYGIEIRLILLWIAGAQLQRCLVRVNELTALGGIWLGKQPLVWNLDEIGVSEKLVAIRHGKLGGFGQRVDVGCRIMAHALEVIPLQDAERKKFRRALARRRILVDEITAIIESDGLLYFRCITGEILVA